MRAERLHKQMSDESSQVATAVRAAARAPRWAMPLARAAIICADASLALAAFLIAFRVREGAPFVVAGSWSAEFEPYAVLVPFVVVARLLMFFYYKLYRLRGEFSYFEDAWLVFKATATASLAIIAAAFLYRGGYAYRTFSYARGVFLLDFCLALVSFGALRVGVRVAQTWFRARGINLIPTLVVGRNREAALCVEEMRKQPSLGYRVIGVVTSETQEEGKPRKKTDELAAKNFATENIAPDSFAAGSFAEAPIVGDVTNLAEIVRETGANEVIVADPNVSNDLLFEAMMKTGRGGVEFRIAPNLFNCLPRKTEIDQIGQMPMIHLFREPLSNSARLAKRAFDIALASLALIILAPLWLLAAVLIKLDSPGAIFYKQERVGMDGRIFLFYKLRTMRAGASDEQHREYQKRLIRNQPDANLGDTSRPIYKLPDDPRVTRTGKLLRRWSLDELPQLLNVLRGDMSLVGPRPPIPYEVEVYETRHRRRLDMKPGLTGLWQVSGRNRLSFEEMVQLDLFYIENWSMLLDLKIIFRTLPVLLRGSDAY